MSVATAVLSAIGGALSAAESAAATSSTMKLRIIWPLSGSLAALDAQQHALGIDIVRFECHHFGDAQAGPIGRGERGLVLRSCCRLKQQRDLLNAEHRRQPLRLPHDAEPARQIRLVQRHRQKETQAWEQVAAQGGALLMG
jgi:hypothetical protein